MGPTNTETVSRGRAAEFCYLRPRGCDSGDAHLRRAVVFENSRWRPCAEFSEGAPPFPKVRRAAYIFCLPNINLQHYRINRKTVSVYISYNVRNK